MKIPVNIVFTGIFNLVGMTRFELATTRPPDAYSTGLSYIPLALFIFATAKLYLFLQIYKSGLNNLAKDSLIFCFRGRFAHFSSVNLGASFSKSRK